MTLLQKEGNTRPLRISWKELARRGKEKNGTLKFYDRKEKNRKLLSFLSGWY